jgi:hypothetical protein
MIQLIQPYARRLTLVLPFLLFFSCASPEKRRREMIEAMGPPQGLLHFRDRLLDGALLVDATLKSIAMPAGRGTAAPSAPDGLPGGMPPGMPPGGPGGMPPPGGGPPPEGFGGGRFGPPARSTLSITLHNLGNDDLAITILSIRSLLVDFAPRPERVLLAPGQRTELQGMPSSYLAALDKVAVELRLKIDGKLEKRVLPLAPATYIPPPPDPLPRRLLLP